MVIYKQPPCSTSCVTAWALGHRNQVTQAASQAGGGGEHVLGATESISIFTVWASPAFQLDLKQNKPLCTVLLFGWFWVLGGSGDPWGWAYTISGPPGQGEGSAPPPPNPMEHKALVSLSSSTRGYF